MRPARAAAIITWIYAAMFGLPVVPIVITELQTGELPWIGTLFQAFAGPWTVGVDPVIIAELLLGFLVLTLIASLSGWWLFKGQRHGAILNLSVMVAEMMFWFGFALPLAWLFGLARIALIAMTWRRLRDKNSVDPL